MLSVKHLPGEPIDTTSISGAATSRIRGETESRPDMAGRMQPSRLTTPPEYSSRGHSSLGAE